MQMRTIRAFCILLITSGILSITWGSSEQEIRRTISNHSPTSSLYKKDNSLRQMDL